LRGDRAASICRRNTTLLVIRRDRELTAHCLTCDKHSAVLGLVQDEPALARRCRKRPPGPDLRAALCRRQVGSEEWSS
jgi:hypothetical protein